MEDYSIIIILGKKEIKKTEGNVFQFNKTKVKRS